MKRISHQVNDEQRIDQHGWTFDRVARSDRKHSIIYKGHVERINVCSLFLKGDYIGRWHSYDPRKGALPADQP